MPGFQPLEKLDLPGDIKTLGEERLRMLCSELRQVLISTVAENGGHLASNLGAVELTVALYRVFDLPADQVVWDVGHQSYVHKILSGRLDRFATLRQEGGLSGFPRSQESPYDAFIAGHASTALSVACGIAKAKTLSGDPHHVIAVVGDGAMTGGLAYEALNNAGRSGDRLIMVLNDNAMSISCSVGSLARYLAVKRSSEGYLNLKGHVEGTLKKIPVVGESMRKAVVSSKTAFRQMIYHSNLFEDLGFDYLGPIDGHDLPRMIQMLAHARSLQKPVVVHVNTVKGKGYARAEKEPSRYHGVGRFDYRDGIVPAKEPKTFSSVFGRELVRLAQQDSRICAVTAAMEDGTGLGPFADMFASKGRFFDVGIAEEHAVTFSCGLAAGGMRPVFAVYSTFLQRAFDQILHDGAIEPRHVVLAVDRAGFVGADGETHQGLFDAAFLSEIPGVAVYSPATYAQLIWALDRCLYYTDGVAAIRYPRGGQPVLKTALSGDYTLVQGKGGLLLVSYGREAAQAEQAAGLLAGQGRQADLLILNRIAPFPEEALQAARRYPEIVFLEEGVLRGGIGEHFMAALSAAGYRGRMRIRAVEAPFMPQMEPGSALKACGLDAESVASWIMDPEF